MKCIDLGSEGNAGKKVDGVVGKVLVTLADCCYQTHLPYWSLNSYLAGLF